MRTIRIFKKSVPLPIVAALIIVAMLVSAIIVYASVTAETKDYTTIGGEVVTVSENLTPLAQGIDVEDSALTAVGDTQGEAVAMTASGVVANTATTQGNYIYTYKLTIATEDVDQVYKVELFKDGTTQGALYVKQLSTGYAATGDYATFTWDIGASLGSAVYQIEVTAVS